MRKKLARIAQAHPATLWLLGAAAFLFLNALTAHLDHDESQYFAGATLASHGLTVFRSFMSLQPPLQTWFYAPAAFLFPDAPFVAMRVLTASLALSGVVMTYYSQRILQVSKATALGTCALMMSCGPFVMASGLVRNDMLAFAAATAGILIALSNCQPDRRLGWTLVGLCFGLAASTKLSFAPYGLFGGLFFLMEGPDRRMRRLASYGGGALLGLLPLLACVTEAPDAAVWGVLTFGAEAPHDWYALSGLHVRLTWLGKAIDLVTFAVQGPLLLALTVVTLWFAFAAPKPHQRSTRLLLSLLIGGMIGAALPTPAQKQYLIALIAPLFILLGLALSDQRGRGTANQLVFASLFVMATIGVIKPAKAILSLRHKDANALEVDDIAEVIGRHLRNAGDAGSVATLSADRLAGSGYFVDPRFAPGPFVLRSGHLLTRREAQQYNVATPLTVDAMLEARPPVGLLTGYEDSRRGPDIEGPLIGWAQRHGYVAIAMPDGVGRLYVCPGRLVREVGCASN